MPFSANCPSCGAPVVFKSSVSFHGVCEFCRSTLVRKSGNLEDLGKMADLLEDASPIRLGTEGRYRGVHFAVIGRIQLRYAAGLWNEWFILFDDQKSGWLSDANGEYVVSFLKPPGIALPPFAELKPGRALNLAGKEFVVTDLEEAMCIAGEGELPFAFGAGYPAQLADLRAPDDTLAAGFAFASLDYSETPPLCFIGESIPFAGLRLSNLRTDAGKDKPAGEVKALQCPACGGPIALHDKAVLAVACPSCLAVLDAENAALKVLQKVSARIKLEPLIPIGSVGRFEDKDWTLIGFQQRAVEADGTDYPWEEYLLHHPTEGFRWLIEADGHWTLATGLASPPRYKEDEPAVTYRRAKHLRFSRGKAVTHFVIGEFNWKVRVGETWETTDFIDPPLILSRETTASETTWSQGRYLAREEVAAAFALKTALPEPQHVAANQPNPHVETHRATCRNFWMFFVLATLAQALWVFALGGKTLQQQALTFQPGNEEPLVTQEFRIDRPARNITLNHQTNAANNWFGLHVTMIDKATGQSWEGDTEISYWEGVDDEGDSWSEGSRERDVIFRDVPEGTYYFVIDPEFSLENPTPLEDRIKVVRDQASWGNYVLLVIFLLIFPLIGRYRYRNFENERWSEADFRPNGKARRSSKNEDGDSDTDSDADSDSGGDSGGDGGGGGD